MLLFVSFVVNFLICFSFVLIFCYFLFVINIRCFYHFVCYFLCFFKHSNFSQNLRVLQIQKVKLWNNPLCLVSICNGRKIGFFPKLENPESISGNIVANKTIGINVHLWETCGKKIIVAKRAITKWVFPSMFYQRKKSLNLLRLNFCFQLFHSLL